MRDHCVRCLYPPVYIYTTAHRGRAFWDMFKPTHQKLTLHIQTLRAHPERRKMRLYGRSRQISDDWQPRPSNLVSYQWRLLRCCQICAAIDGGIRHDNAVYLFHLVIRFTGVAYVAFCSARMRAFCRELSVSFARFTACATVLFLLLALFLATLFHSLSLSLLYLSCAFFRPISLSLSLSLLRTFILALSLSFASVSRFRGDNQETTRSKCKQERKSESQRILLLFFSHTIPNSTPGSFLSIIFCGNELYQ